MLKKTSKLFGILKNEKNEIDALLHYISNEKFNKKPKANKWSIGQIIHHIYQAESQTLAAIKWRMANKTEFPDVNLIAYFRVYYTISLFWLKIKFKSPEMVEPDESFISKTELLENWKQSRKEWSDFIYKFPKKFRHKVVYKHPILGYLDLSLTLIFMFHHLFRHKTQIIRIIKENNIPI